MEAQHRCGVIVTKNVIKERNMVNKTQVEWNSKGQPVEPGKASLSSYITAVTRKRVPITVDYWSADNVLQYKNAIWDDVKLAFDVDESRRKYVITLAGDRHRSFRYYLSTMYVFDMKGNPKPHLPGQFSELINQDEWDIFVAQCSRKREMQGPKVSQKDFMALKSVIEWFKKEMELFKKEMDELSAKKMEVVKKDPKVTTHNVEDSYSCTSPFFNLPKTPEVSQGKRKVSQFTKELVVTQKKKYSPVHDTLAPTVAPLSVSGDNSYLDSLQMYYNLRLQTDAVLTFNMERDIFGSKGECVEYIGGGCVSDLLHHKWLDITVVNTYCSYLYKDLMVPSATTRRFVFISSQGISRGFSINDRLQYAAKRFCNHPEGDRLFLAPYNTGQHWVLLAINLIYGTIYFLDPSHRDPKIYTHLKIFFTNAIAIYRTQIGQRMPLEQLETTTWSIINCPRHDNDNDCGYYVMRFMKEIITQKQTTIPKEYFPECKCVTYTMDELNEVKEDWARHVMTTCMI